MLSLFSYTSRLLYSYLLLSISNEGPQTNETQQLVYSWSVLDYTWPTPAHRESAIADGTYKPENNALVGIKLYKTRVYVTVPRWKSGVPSTLNVIAEKQESKNVGLLRPFPNWDMQTIGDCNKLQFVQSMEIDPNTGWMWIIDTGRINTKDPQRTGAFNLCPPKLVIYDMEQDKIVRIFQFPPKVVSSYTAFLNDIVLDYNNGRACYAYITNSGDASLIVYDFFANTAWTFEHPISMEPEEGLAKIIRAGGDSVVKDVPIDGIAMSYDFDYIYYSPLSAFSLYQVSTEILRRPPVNMREFSARVRSVGRKSSQADGMMYSSENNLYFGALSLDSVYKWEIGKDQLQQRNKHRVLMNTTTLVAKDANHMQWVDAFGFEDSHEDGFLWLTSNRLQLFFDGRMKVTGKEPNFNIWKLKVNEHSYLKNAAIRTRPIKN